MICYADGEYIEYCENYQKDASECIRYARAKKINIELVKEDAPFRELCDRWLKPCMQYMASVDSTNWDADKMFFQETTSEVCQSFYDALRKCAQGLSPYDEDGNGASKCPYREIAAEVDKKAANAPEYMRLRVKALCVFLSTMPGDAFSGDSWWEAFAKADVQQIEVEPEQIFELQLENVEKLFERELHNPRENACKVYVRDENVQYTVTIPAGGSILALFADEECAKLVNLKSNLFVVHAGEGTMGVLSQGKVYMCQGRNCEKYLLETTGRVLDAAPDGDGSFVVRNSCGLDYLGENRQIPKKPIRIYGTSNLWVQQYEDFRLEGNLEDCPERAVSVAAGTNCIMIWDGTAAWKCMRVGSQKACRTDFVTFMMNPFVCSQQYCESMGTKRVTVSVRKDGEIVVATV